MIDTTRSAGQESDVRTARRCTAPFHLEAFATEAQPVPDLTDLLKDSPSNWGKWGEDDEVGSLDYLGAGFQASSTELVAAGRGRGHAYRTAAGCLAPADSVGKAPGRALATPILSRTARWRREDRPAGLVQSGDQPVALPQRPGLRRWVARDPGIGDEQ